MNDLKEKIDRFKTILKDFDKLEKSVQVKLMDVADKLAPGVQGGMIAPKEVRVPEPKEYPDIEEKVVPVHVRKHQLEQFADQFLKSDWHPVQKTQKNPSTTIPYEEKPEHKDYIKSPDNLSGQMKADRDAHNAKSPSVPPELHASGAMNKTDIKKDGAMGPTLGSVIGFPGAPPTAPIGKAAKASPDKSKMGKNWAYNWSR